MTSAINKNNGIRNDNNCIDIDCPKLDDINIMNLSASWVLKYFSVVSHSFDSAIL